MHVLFTSAECYPAAKVGGLADVVGSLPKYLCKTGARTSVVIPAYEMPWFEGKQYTIHHQGHFHLGGEHLYFEVRYFINDPLGFPFYTIHIPTKFDRYGVYAGHDGRFFGDEVYRLIAFQRAILIWVRDSQINPDIIHCHDHHTGLIPFLKRYAYEFQPLQQIPTVFTIHNERYQGNFGWSLQYLLPQFDNWKSGLLDWNNTINPLASAVRCADFITTVSPSYMEELMYDSMGLENLFRTESFKCRGILNGIDNEVWNPSTDPMIDFHLADDPVVFKKENKRLLCEKFGLDPQLPLYGFIGRLAQEKGAEFIAGIVDTWLSHHRNANFVLLGTGDKGIEHSLASVASKYSGHVACMLTYNEALSRKIYSGADFLLMPSRVEPCGLNQMFAMRYGTIPIVRAIGGLKDSVQDYMDPGGVGIRFNHMYFDDIMHAVWRAFELFHTPDVKNACVRNAMLKDFSWDKSASNYMDVYNALRLP